MTDEQFRRLLGTLNMIAWFLIMIVFLLAKLALL